MLWIAGASSLAYMLATSVGVWPAIHALSLAAAFLVGYQWQSPWPWHVLAWVLLANLAAALWFGTEYGIAGNPNYFGVTLAIALAGCFAYSLWWYTPLLVFGIYWTNSRTAMGGAAVALFLGVWRRYPAIAWCLALLAILGAVTVVKGDGSIAQRLGIWQMAINNITVLGSGWGSFTSAIDALPVKTNLTAMLAPAAYNDFLQLVFELGIGVIPLLVFVALCCDGRDEGAWTVIATYAIMSLTYFPLWVPVAGHFTMLALGQLAASPKERIRQWRVGDLPRVIT